MSRLSRRSLLSGAAGASALVALNRFTPTRLVRAQGAAYEIVSFGPMTEGVRTEGDFIPAFGGIIGLHANGTAYGNMASSAEKYTPTLFMPDGSVSKLKSGEFGGNVRGMNADGHAVGAVFETEVGREHWGYEEQSPALWIDRELTRLPLPDPKTEYSDDGGRADAISDGGVILGQARGHNVLWVDGDVQTLPEQTAREESLAYLALTPDGTLIARTTSDSTGETVYQYGVIENGEFTPFDLPGDATIDYPGTASSNSANEVLFSFWPTDLHFNIIVAPGEDPIVIDYREQGIEFSSSSFNASRVLIGSLQMRAGDDYRPALLQDGEFTVLEDLLPPGHGFSRISASRISDEGIISGSGYDEKGDFHPLLFVPA